MNAATGWTTRQAINQSSGAEHNEPEKQQQQAEFDNRAATIVGELAGDTSLDKKEELTSKAEAILSEAKAAGIQLRAFVSSSDIPGAVSQRSTNIKPAITYSPYSEEHVEALQTVIRESREEDKNESPTIPPDLNPAPSFFKDPLGAFLHWLESIGVNGMSEKESQINGAAQYHAEQKMANQNPAFAEALEREDGPISSRTQELNTPIHQIAQQFAQQLGTPSSLRFEGCKGNQAMPDETNYIPAEKVVPERDVQIQRVKR